MRHRLLSVSVLLLMSGFRGSSAGGQALEKAGLSVPTVPATPARKASAGPEDKTGAQTSKKEYTVSIAPLTGVPATIEWSRAENGEETSTIIGRARLAWQEVGQETEPAPPYELEADSLVLWRNVAEAGQPKTGLPVSSQGGVTQVYVQGDVVLRQGERTIRADEMFYDLQNQRALARNVVLETFDTTRRIPVFVRARELRQLAPNEFEGRDIVLTTSEFWRPQMALEAARIHVTDRTEVAKPEGILPKSSLDVEARDVRIKYYNLTVLRLPVVRSDRDRPDVPIRSISVGQDRAFGTSVETRWYLSRLLGLKEPEGTDSWLDLDYYGKRGPAGGIEVNYEREDSFGSLLGYIIDDHGEDRLSRTRKNVAVPDETRGRFRLQHRQFLPYHWQLTGEVSYLSDQNFLEQFYRTEFNVGKEQETLLHLKRIQDNWGLSLLGKVRINDFQDQIEELPSAEYHLTGQSLFDDRFTFFSDSQVSRYRFRLRSGSPVREPDDFFVYTATRNELDLPMNLGLLKAVPFVAGTLGYDDGAGFRARLDDEPAESEDLIGIGEAGVRVSTPSFWCVYPQVESRLLDLHQLRHVIQPTLEAVAYTESDAVAEQRDTLDLGISQRLQTKRGLPGRQRTVDWLELNTDFVWVNESSEESPAPDRFIWNTPFIPLANRIGTVIPPLDRRTTGLFGPRQNYVSADMTLRLTDTTAVLSDAYFGMQTGTLEQFDVGFSRLCWPNLSYYVGTRYLRSVENGLGQHGSNALTLSATYVLDPRYTAVVSQQYDFAYGKNIRTDIALIRKYHRLNLALTYSIDESLDEQRIVLSLWPEGLTELAFGLRRYMGLGASDVLY
jgi:hypothetical protein